MERRKTGHTFFTGVSSFWRLPCWICFGAFRSTCFTCSAWAKLKLFNSLCLTCFHFRYSSLSFLVQLVLVMSLDSRWALGGSLRLFIWHLYLIMMTLVELKINKTLLPLRGVASLVLKWWGIRFKCLPTFKKRKPLGPSRESACFVLKRWGHYFKITDNGEG